MRRRFNVLANGIGVTVFFPDSQVWCPVHYFKFNNPDTPVI